MPCALASAIASDAARRHAAVIVVRATTSRLIGFDGEEAFRTWSETDGLYGSRHFARQVAGTAPVHVLRAVIVLDMVETMRATEGLSNQAPSSPGMRSNRFNVNGPTRSVTRTACRTRTGASPVVSPVHRA